VDQLINQLVRALIRGFGFRLGWRAARRVPLVPAIVVIGLLWLLLAR
jgi:hypothetical protein